MYHRGLKVEQIMMKQGIGISKIAKIINLSEEHVQVLLGDRFLDYELIHFIGKNIGHDFSNEFPDLKNNNNL